MGFLDKAQAKVSEVTKAAQDGIADQQAKRKADGLLRELGAWTYAKHKGGFDEADENIARLLGELAAHEAEHGELGKKEEAAAGAAAPAAAAAHRHRPRRRRRPRPPPTRSRPRRRPHPCRPPRSRPAPPAPPPAPRRRRRLRRLRATRCRRPRLPAEPTIMTRVGVFGAAGRMGSTVCEAVEGDPDLELVAAVDPLHAGIDLRRVANVDTPPPGGQGVRGAASTPAPRSSSTSPSPKRARQNLAFAAEHGLHAVVGTTGFADADFDAIRHDFTKSSCLVAANFAIGAVLMMRFAELAAPWFETAEIIELHHDGKIDAPSGTAMRTAERMASSSSEWSDDPTTSHVVEGARGGSGPGWHPDPLGAAPRPVRPPGGAARHVRPEPHHPPRHLRPHLLHARRPPRGQAGPRAPRPHPRPRTPAGPLDALGCGQSSAEPCLRRGGSADPEPKMRRRRRSDSSEELAAGERRRTRLG